MNTIERLDRFANLGIRGITGVLRLVFAIYLARHLPPEDVGLYGLIAATISFSVLGMGGEVYTYAQRQFVSADSSERWNILINQFVMTAPTFCFGLLVQAVPFTMNLLPLWLAAIYFPLLIAEYAAQELSRVLVNLNQQLVSSLSLLVRTAGWVPVLIWLMYYRPDDVTLRLVLWLWLAGGVLALALSIPVVLQNVPRTKTEIFGREWFKDGIPVAAGFVFASLALRGLSTFDRYFVEAVSSRSYLGIFTFFYSLASVPSSIAIPLVFSYVQPRLVRSFRRGDLQDYRIGVREANVWTVAVLALTVVGYWLALPQILVFVNRPEYREHVPTFVVLLIASSARVYSMVAHYQLYAQSRDKVIAVAHGLGFATFLLLGVAGILVSNVIVVLAAVLAGSIVIAVFKTGAVWILQREIC